MRTAQQWTEEIQNGLAVTSVGSQLETDLLLHMATLIQLDAYRSGMEEAAKICGEYANQMRGAHVNCNTSSADVKRMILAARDKKVMPSHHETGVKK